MDFPYSLNAPEVQFGIQKYGLQHYIANFEFTKDPEVQEAMKKVFILFVCEGHGTKLDDTKVAFYNYDALQEYKETLRNDIELITKYEHKAILFAVFKNLYEDMQKRKDSEKDLENLYRAFYFLFKYDSHGELGKTWAAKMNGNSGFLKSLKELFPFFANKVCNIKVEHKRKTELSVVIKELQKEDVKEDRDQVSNRFLRKWYEENNLSLEDEKNYAFMFRHALESTPLKRRNEKNNIGVTILSRLENGNFDAFSKKKNEILKRKKCELKYRTSPNDVSDIGRNEDNHNKRRRLFED